MKKNDLKNYRAVVISIKSLKESNEERERLAELEQKKDYVDKWVSELEDELLAGYVRDKYIRPGKTPTDSRLGIKYHCDRSTLIRKLQKALEE